MSPNTPRAAYRRPLTMAVAAAVAGSAFMIPAMSASAANVAGVVAPTTSDVSGWKDDAFTPKTVSGITWTWKVKGATEATTVAGGTPVQPFKDATSAPGASGLTIVVTADAGTGNTVNSGTQTVEYELTFKATADKFVSLKAPTVKVDKTTGLDVVSVPKLTGAKWQVVTSAVSTAADVEAGDYTPGATVTWVTFSAVADAGYTLTDAAKVAPTSFKFNVKAAAKEVDVAGFATSKVTVVDGPGTSKDYADVIGVEGVDWKQSEKSLNIKPGAVKRIKPVKGTTGFALTAVAAKGFTLTNTIGAVGTVTENTVVDHKATAVGLVVTLPVDPAIKGWTFTPTGGKALKIAPPKGAAAYVVTMPAAGELKLELQTGYVLKSGNTGILAVAAS